LPEATVP
jgi:hypothetical protein